MRIELSRFIRSKYFPFPRSLIYREEEAILRKYAIGKKSLVEIGVFEGASARCIASSLSPDAVLTLIDPFVPDSKNPNLVARQFFTKWNFDQIKGANVRLIQDYSHRVVNSWSDRIDFLFIDGDHHYEACSQDWKQWSRYIVPGGIVIFHDARMGKSNGAYWDGFEGPTLVIQDILSSAQFSSEWQIVEEFMTMVVLEKR